MAKLTYTKRKHLRKSSFALPGKRKFPIMDISHARNALARAAQGVKKGTLSRSAAATIKRKVKKKYPSIGRK